MTDPNPFRPVENGDKQRRPEARHVPEAEVGETAFAQSSAAGVVEDQEDRLISAWRSRLLPDADLHATVSDADAAPSAPAKTEAISSDPNEPESLGEQTGRRRLTFLAPRQAHDASIHPETVSETQEEAQLFTQYHKNRRDRRAKLLTRLALFVLIPTVLVWLYVSLVSVPLYTANAVISVTKPAPESNASGLGILGAVNGGGQLREAFMVLEFMRSPAALEALENEVGLISYYSSDEMDPVGRVRDLEFLQISQSRSLARYVKTSINVQSGLISATVKARSREDSLTFLFALLESAEKHMNELSAGLFAERMAQADGAVERAQEAVQQSRRNLVRVQIENGEISPQATVAGIYDAISVLELERLNLDRQILALEPFSEDGPEILDKKSTARDEYTQLIDVQRARLIDKSSGRSLNEKLTAHESAQATVLVAEQTLAAALAGQNEARRAAELGVSRFQVVVPPRAPEISTYPNRLQVTALAFFLFLAGLAVFSVVAPRTT